MTEIAAISMISMNKYGRGMQKLLKLQGEIGISRKVGFEGVCACVYASPVWWEMSHAMAQIPVSETKLNRPTSILILLIYLYYIYQ